MLRLFSLISLSYTMLFYSSLYANMSNNIQNSSHETKTIIKTPITANSEIYNSNKSLPFGYNLFSKSNIESDKSGISPYYKLSSGDRVNVNIWGAVSSQSVMVVDPQGNIFIPEVGPIKLAGVRARNINHVIQSHIRRVYQNNVEVYVNLEDRVPVSIFISGKVRAPGRYAGNAGDSIIDYISKAGGIDLERGSFRKIQIRRNKRLIETYDFYNFLLKGDLPRTVLQEGDSVVVMPKGNIISAKGSTDHPYGYEFLQKNIIGRDLISYAIPYSGTTDIFISGFRNNEPFQKHMLYDDFLSFPLENQDNVTFEQGNHNKSLQINISGKHLGHKTMVLPLDARLHEILDNIPIQKEISKIDSIYIKRKSVAESQKKSLQDSIKRLQETLLLARASGKSQSTPVGEGELKLLDGFIAKTENLNPEGRVVVMHDGYPTNMLLEDGDEIVIPQYSDLVTINGEVHLPKAIAWHDNMNVYDYIERSGGFRDNANEDNIIILRASGEAIVGRGEVLPGDQIIVMPEVKINNLDLASSVADIIYKAVLAVAIPISLDD